MEIYDVVSKLIGEIKPIGETNIDHQRLENLEEMMNPKIVDLSRVKYKQTTDAHARILVGL